MKYYKITYIGLSVNDISKYLSYFASRIFEKQITALNNFIYS